MRRLGGYYAGIMLVLCCAFMILVPEEGLLEEDWRRSLGRRGLERLVLADSAGSRCEKKCELLLGCLAAGMLGCGCLGCGMRVAGCGLRVVVKEEETAA